jgi:hypothetical protein
MAKSRVLAARRTCFKPHNEPVTFAYCNSSASCDRLRKCGVVDCRARQGTDPSGTQPLSVSACTDAQKVPAQPLSGSGALLHRHDAFHGSMPKYMNFIRYDKAVANGRMLILYLRTQIRVAKKTPLRVEPLAGDPARCSGHTRTTTTPLLYSPPNGYSTLHDSIRPAAWLQSNHMNS